MVKPRLADAISLIGMVKASCGSIDELEKALRILEDYYHYGVAYEGSLEEASQLLRDAALVFRSRGCLDYYLLEQAADIIEHMY